MDTYDCGIMDPYDGGIQSIPHYWFTGPCLCTSSTASSYSSCCNPSRRCAQLVLDQSWQVSIISHQRSAASVCQCGCSDRELILSMKPSNTIHHHCTCCYRHSNRRMGVCEPTHNQYLLYTDEGNVSEDSSTISIYKPKLKIEETEDAESSEAGTSGNVTGSTSSCSNDQKYEPRTSRSKVHQFNLSEDAHEGCTHGYDDVLSLQRPPCVVCSEETQTDCCGVYRQQNLRDAEECVCTATQTQKAIKESYDQQTQTETQKYYDQATQTDRRGLTAHTNDQQTQTDYKGHQKNTSSQTNDGACTEIPPSPSVQEKTSILIFNKPRSPYGFCFNDNKLGARKESTNFKCQKSPTKCFSFLLNEGISLTKQCTPNIELCLSSTKGTSNKDAGTTINGMPLQNQNTHTSGKNGSKPNQNQAKEAKNNQKRKSSHNQPGTTGQSSEKKALKPCLCSNIKTAAPTGDSQNSSQNVELTPMELLSKQMHRIFEGQILKKCFSKPGRKKDSKHMKPKKSVRINEDANHNITIIG